jgi:hypothetical protein
MEYSNERRIEKMREKYVEERFPRYFEFGTHQDGRLVDIASSLNDTVATVAPEHAINLIKDRDAVLDMLVKLALKLDEIDTEAFKKIWY